MAQPAEAPEIPRTSVDLLRGLCAALRSQLEKPRIKEMVEEAVQDHVCHIKAGQRNAPGSSSSEVVFNKDFVGKAIEAYLRDNLHWTSDNISHRLYVEGWAGCAPAGQARQLFTKSDVTKETFPKTWNESSAPLTPRNACPDFAIRHQGTPFQTVGEVKYFKAGTPALALYNVAREATFYLGAFAANRDPFNYDSAVIVVADASPDQRFCKWIREGKINQELYKRLGKETGIYLVDIALQ